MCLVTNVYDSGVSPPCSKFISTTVSPFAMCDGDSDAPFLAPQPTLLPQVFSLLSASITFSGSYQPDRPPFYCLTRKINLGEKSVYGRRKEEAKKGES